MSQHYGLFCWECNNPDKCTSTEICGALHGGYPRPAPAPDALLELLRDSRIQIKNSQWVVHCGQFHQWKAMEQCTEAGCRLALALLARLDAEIQRIAESKKEKI